MKLVPKAKKFIFSKYDKYDVQWFGKNFAEG